MKTNTLYPMIFSPILKEKIWGGEKLKTELQKTTTKNNIGESWEISAVKGDVSILNNGTFKGENLQDLLKRFKGQLIGEKNYNTFGDTFPLLIKFIDAKQDLSVQLHPNDALAKARHDSFGKTEMWYVLQADSGARLNIDFKNKTNKNTYLTHLQNKTLPDILNFETVTKGDTFFIEVGRVHAIGAGVLLAEIQQTSDITYRIYDWDRVDSNGNERELHTDLALDAINFNMGDDYKKNYSKNINTPNTMVQCPYFSTQYLPIKNTTIHKENTYDSFIIYMCTEGEAHFTTLNFKETIRKGETILLPAAISEFEISAQEAILLEVYV